MTEKENFFRFCGILQDIGAKVLREVFLDKCVGTSSTSTLAGYLSLHKKHLTGLRPNIIRKEQFDLLYPSGGGAPVIEDLDITLLCLLFRNLDTQLTPYDSIWKDPQNHQTYQADVTRIKLIRNKFFGHVSSTLMSNGTYTNEVSNLTTIYQRLVQSLPAGRMSYTELQELIHRELNDPLPIGLDREVKRLKEEMQERYKNDEDFKKAVLANQDETRKHAQEMAEKLQGTVKDIKDIQERQVIYERDVMSRNVQDDDLKRAVKANQEETRRHAIELSELSGKHEGLRKDIKDIQKRDSNGDPVLKNGQLERSRQWDSLSSENQQVAMDDMRRQIDRSKEVLKRHREHAAQFFVRNQRYITGENILNRHGKILITGKAGQGKTYLAYQLLLKCLDDKNNARPLIISTADEWKKLADSSTELAIVVDDMCGKYGLLQGELKHWNENARFITALIDNRKHTVIFTMRTHIYKETGRGLQLESEISDPLFCENITLNLESDIMNLNEEDKIEFANKYLKQFDLPEDEVLQLCRVNESSIGFPFLCRAAQSIEDKSKLYGFFISPLEIMFRELERLRMEKSIFYGCLVLAMLAGGTLKSESINEDSITRDRKKEVMIIFGSYSGPDVKLADIQQAANTLCRTYLLFSDSDESYSFVHNAVEEAVFLSYGKLHQTKTLQSCSLQSVCKLCRISNESQSSNNTAPALMLDLTPKHHDILIERFIKVLETKVPSDFANIAEANVWSSEQFRNLFADKCKTIHVLADTDQNSLLVHAANANNRDLSSELLRGMKKNCAEYQVPAIRYLTKAAKASCVHKDLCLFKQFMKTGDVNGNDILSITVEKGSDEAMEFLLQNGADINYQSENGESLLHTACLHARLHMVKLLKSKYSLLVNQFDSRGRSVCHCAASGGSVEILKFLIQEGADPIRTDNDGMNLLHYACLEGKKEMAFYLMDNYSNMLYNVAEGEYSVPYFAAYGGSIDIFKRTCKLMKAENQTDCNSQSEDKETNHQQQADQKAISKDGKTLLHMACANGKLDMTNNLAQNHPAMISEDKNFKGTLAYYTERGGNVSVLQYLIKQGLGPWYRTATQETLLHGSCFKGQLEMSKYLVEKYPDMINEVDNCKRTPGHYAACGGNVSVLQYLIDQGLDPWCRTAKQQTLLHRSCLNGQLEMSKYLVEKYPDMINQVDNCKGTPAHDAASGGNVSVLQYLIDQGLDPWCRTATQETLLHMSCLNGQLEMSKYLVEKYPDMINQVDNCKRTPAHDAACGGNVSVLQYLIDQGLDPWCRTATQETLLHGSCLNGQLEMSKCLVEKYPDMINQVDNCKGTPGHDAASGGNVSVLQYLIDQGLDPWCRTATQETLLHMSCLNGQLEMSKYLVEKYPDMINQVDNCKGTPAHDAACGGNVSVLQYLTDQGLDPWCRTATQETLLHMSCFKGQLEMSKCLVEKYPDMINQVDNCKGTPAHDAASGGNVSVLQYLIDQGLDPWCRTATQQTLLHRSCLNGQLEMSKYLVEKYPDMINQVDNCKGTPGHYAACGGNVSVLQYLIDQGLDPWCRTATQQTLLHGSCLNGQLEMSKCLVEKYPDMINQVDNCKGTPGHDAACGGNVSVLQYLIDQGLDPWCRTATQETLLHMSCFKGQLEMSKYLVEKYPDMINQVDNCKGTPAHDAASGGNVSVLEYLIDQGLDPWCRTATQETLLHRSCFKGQLEMSKCLVEKYPDMINEVDNCKGTPAHDAASGGNVSVLQYLIDQDLDPWCRTATQETLLHRSCLNGQLEMSKYLVEKYPDMINQVDNCKRTPAHYAASSGNVSVLEYLIDQGLDPWCRTATQETLLHRSCFKGQLEMSKYLVEKYLDMINEVDNCKGTPGHYAASGGNVSVLQYLIDQGLDPWCRTAKQDTLLHMSCFKGQLEMSKCLVEKYPDMINQVDNCKRTPAHGAACGGNVSVLQYLIDQGLDPWCRTATQETLLHRSCLNGQLEMSKYLVEKYPDMINEVDNCKGTPGHYAASGGNVSVLQYLIDQGLDPWCRTATQDTLLHRSCLNGQLEMSKCLVEKYPDMINQVDNCKRTPAHDAASGGNVSVLEYLIDQGLDPWCRTATQETLLHRSCLNGQLEMSKYLVEKYPDMINQVDNCKGTPAHDAASGGNVSVLQYLIDQGLDPWCRTATQETLLHRSCLNGQLEMSKYLVEKYPDMINQVDNCKRTPAHDAACGGNVSVLQYLTDQGLDPWCRTATQETLLHRSCFKGQLEMSKCLVEKYPDMINQVDNCKGTPAHDAASGGNVSVLQYLIDQGLDPWCRTATQETLLHRSCLNGQLEMSKYLVEKYPDMINQVDNCKGTPGQYAASGGNVSVLQYLIDQGLDPWCRTATQQTLLHGSCLNVQLEMSKYLVEKYPYMINQVDNCKGTPAHDAASGGNVSVLQYLIDQGLDPWCRTATQETLLHMSCFKGQLEMSKYLVEKYPDMINEVDNCKGTPAHDAASGGNVSVLEYLIDQGLDPWCRTATQETLLHRSCFKGQLEMSKCLVEKYPDMINEVDNCKGTPAHDAASGGNVSVLQYLIDQGLDPWCRTATQETLLHRSCLNGQLEMSKYLVEKYPDMINQVDNCKRTPAHYAASSGNVSVLEYLIDQGLDQWCRTATQQTLLHRSCFKGQLEMSKYLVEKYPDMINQVDNWKGTPGHYAASGGNVSVLQYLIDQGLDPWCRTAKQDTLLHMSCFKGQLEMSKYLVEKYPDMINQVDNCKRTPAHGAACGGNVSVLQYLIDQGLDPWCRTATQETLLHRSCLNGQLEMSKYLVEKYPDMINEVDNCKGTPGHYAASGGNVSVLQYLIDQGLDPWCRTATQDTLLHRSCLNGQLEMSKCLVEKYPDMINQVDNCKGTPGHDAASGGNVSVLQYLIDQGLDPWCRTATQETLLHRSCLNGQLEMSKYLVEKYPDMINQVDNCKRTPAHDAACGGNVSVLQYLTDQGLDPWCRTATQETLLHRSCFKGQLEMSKCLVEKYPDMINQVDNCKGTPAHDAASGGNVSVLQYLIDQGLDPWCRTATQQTLLHRSCLNGQLEMSKYLVEKYPDMINQVDNCKGTPGQYAASGGNVSVLQYLIDQGLDPWCRTATQQTLLHGSCLNVQLEMSKYLVEKYPYMINQVDNCKGTPAHDAASGGNVSVLQYLIDQGLDPWCRTATQETLLHMSCFKGQLEMSKYLVEKYPDMINEVDNCKGTPAHDAASGGNVSVLEYLIDQGLDPWCRTATQETLLHRSCFKGQLEMSKCLVEKYPDMINEVDNCKGTPAHDAASGGNVSVLQYLIDQGLDPWCRTATQETLLHRSCLNGQLEMSKYLVEKYPDMINQVDNCKRTPAHYAASSGNVSVLEYLIDQGLDPWCRTATQQTLLHRSCFKGQLEMSKYLVEKYPDMINEVDNWKGTPGHYAASGGNVSVLQYLIDQGLDPWCRTAKQDTLLHMSCFKGQLEMSKYLVEKYPDMINQVDNCKRTPAHDAACGGNVSVLQYLIDQGLDPWCRTATQETLLHRSCLNGQLEMSKYLVEKYPDMINEVDNCKGTPGHYAASGGNVSVLQYLIDQGLDPWCRTATQDTLLHRSCLNGQLEMSKYLVEKYPDMINQVDNCKRTPAHDAACGGNVSVLEYLIDQGLDPWCRTATQETLLHRSCLNGQLEMSKCLVEKYPDMINQVDNCKGTPAHDAASGGNVSVLQYLIDQGLDPWCRTATQETLLHRSCLNGQLEMSKYLVEKYPDMINQVDNCKRTPAHDAACGGNVSVLQYLTDQGLDPWCRTATQETLLHRSCFKGQLEMSKCLVEKYPDMINQVDNCKRTPAHDAACSGNVSVLQYLIDQGLDPWCRTATQQTLLHRSCLNGQLEMSKYLVEKYPDMINQVDNCKGTPGHYAASGGNVSVLQYLIDQGLDPWCRTATQQTLLHRSCLNGQLEMSKYLVEKYPDMINQVDNCKGTPAHDAASGGNVSVLQYLIDQGLDPWCRTATQETLLHMSCFKGQLEMSKYLVEKYPDMINEVDNCKGTPAHDAASGGNVSVLEYLIDQGLDPWCRTATQETLLHRSCFKGQLEMNKCLVEKYPDMINEVDNCKGTPAHDAASGGNVSVLQYLIDQGLDPWCRTATQETLLHRSCLNGQLEMSKYLVEKYPDMINQVDNCKRTPAHYAASSGNVSVLEYLIDHGLDPWCRTATQQTLLHRSCFKGQLEMSKYLVEKYPDMINEVDNWKGTPGHYAASGGNFSVLEYLIDQGLDPWCRTAKQDTLLHMSCFKGQLEMSKCLVEKYPDMINQVDNCKRTPAHGAACGGNVSVLQYLIDQGLDPWCRTATQETLLHRSCLNGQLEMSKYLVEKYPDMINQVDNCKRTPAHYAASSGNVSVLEYLIDQGLDPWCRTATQETLLHRSCFKGQLEMSKYLVEKYPDMINQVDNWKGTPGHYAASGGNVSVLEYLIDQGLDPWCRTAKQDTLLHMSCFKGQLEMSKHLVEKYPDMISEVDNCKGTPGHYAAAGGKVYVYQYLIDQGLDPWCRTVFV